MEEYYVCVHEDGTAEVSRKLATKGGYEKMDIFEFKRIVAGLQKRPPMPQNRPKIKTFKLGKKKLTKRKKRK